MTLHVLLGLGKCLMACVHPHSLIQKCLPTLKSPVVHLSILPPSQPLASSDPFIVSIVLPFPEGWDQTERSLWRLTSFFQQDAFKIPPGCDFTADLFLTLTNIPLFLFMVSVDEEGPPAPLPRYVAPDIPAVTRAL